MYYAAILSLHTPIQALHLPPTAAEMPRVMYLIRTGGQNVSDRIGAVLDTWAREVPKSQLLFAGPSTDPGPRHNYLSMMGVHEFECADDHTWLSCVTAKATIHAFFLSRKQEFDWLLIIDDDVWVHTKNLGRTLQELPVDEAKAFGWPGCGECSLVGGQGHGMCGGTGYAMSRKTLAALMDRKGADRYYNEFMSTAEKLANWRDAAFGCLSKAYDINLAILPGSRPIMPNSTYEDCYRPVTFHPVKPDDMYKFQLDAKREPSTVSDHYCQYRGEHSQDENFLIDQPYVKSLNRLFAEDLAKLQAHIATSISE